MPRKQPKPSKKVQAYKKLNDDSRLDKSSTEEQTASGNKLKLMEAIRGHSSKKGVEFSNVLELSEFKDNTEEEDKEGGSLSATSGA